MTGETCIACGKTCKSEPKLAFHRFPKDAEKCAKWVKEIGLSENQVKSHSRVCTRNFCDGDSPNGPEMNVGNKICFSYEKRCSIELCLGLL